MLRSIGKIVVAGWSVFFLITGAGVAEEAPEYTNLGIEPREVEPEESGIADPDSVPGAELNAGRPLSAEEEAMLQAAAPPQQTPADSSGLEKIWKEKGYDRPIGSEEKEKRPEAIFGNRDIREEVRKIREGSY